MEEENMEKKKKRRRLVAEYQIVHQHQITHPNRSVLLPSSPTRSSSLALRSSGFVFLQVVAFFRFCFSSSPTKIEFVRVGFGF